MTPESTRDWRDYTQPETRDALANQIWQDITIHGNAFQQFRRSPAGVIEARVIAPDTFTGDTT